MKYNLAYGSQFIDKKDINIVSNSLKEKLITTGKYVKSFEENLKNKLNSKFSFTCINGTAGLHLAFMAINLKKYDVVIMPSINFISSYRVANLIGAKIYLTDVDPVSGQMTPMLVQECIKKNKLKKIKAIVTMYLGGYPENIIDFYKIKKQYSCFLIEDACHAFGSKYEYRKQIHYIGSCKHSDLCVFSFHPVKTITTGEGGAITTNNKFLAKRIKLLKNHGIVKEKQYWKYDIRELGFNYRLSDINCALGLSQLNKLEKFITKRKNIFLTYKNKLKNLKSFLNFPCYSNNFNSYHLFIIKVNFKKLKTNKDKMFRHLIQKGIYPQFHYVPINKFSFYKNKNNEEFKGAEEYYNNSFSLPIYYDLKKNELLYIIKIINNFITKNR